MQENRNQDPAGETDDGNEVGSGGKPVWVAPRIVEILIARDTNSQNAGSSDGTYPVLA